MKGWSIGASFQRALICDIRVAAVGARMMLPEVTYGVIPDTGGIGRLYQMCGHGLVSDLVLTGRALSAEEALDWGLVNRVVPAADLMAEVRTYADTMLAYSPTALKVLKQSFNTDTEHMISIGNMAYTTLKMFGETDESKEGITAFNEKRQPDLSQYRGN